MDDLRTLLVRGPILNRSQGGRTISEHIRVDPDSVVLSRQRQALKPARAVQSITDGINGTRCSHCMLSEPIGHFPRG
ncbi:unannotated protein [freshwater metagenome]|uniref:Unannotated protein n=1 Tax=freshwater metagenome TaxID=449393 RepID=A0A6J6WB90_9ZZZZ